MSSFDTRAKQTFAVVAGLIIAEGCAAGTSGAAPKPTTDGDSLAGELFPGTRNTLPDGSSKPRFAPIPMNVPPESLRTAAVIYEHRDRFSPDSTLNYFGIPRPYPYPPFQQTWAMLDQFFERSIHLLFGPELDAKNPEVQANSFTEKNRLGIADLLHYPAESTWWQMTCYAKGLNPETATLEGFVGAPK